MSERAEKCKTCRFWSRIGDTARGECLRFPPRVLPTEGHDPTGDIDRFVATQFPVTTTGEWCGEYRPVEAPPPGEYPKNWADVLPDVGMSVRARKTCWRLRVRTMDELGTKTFEQVMAQKNTGATTVVELQGLLAERGLSFRGDPRSARW